MPDPVTDPTSDELRRTLNTIADDLALEPASPSAVMQRGATRRRRRRAALGGGTAVVTIALVGAVVANRDRGDDTLELSTPPATTVPDVGGDATADDAPETTVTTPPTMPPIANDVGSTGSVVATAIGPQPGQTSQLLPWRDGFLSIGFQYEAQPLGPLSDEIVALFPEEVTALFPDGLPPTIAEATQVLSEAGLLDEVSAVLEEHPEASAAIYAQSPLPPVVTASYTVDGADWTVTDLTPPTDYPGQFIVGGDRLVTWSMDGSEGDPSSTRRLTIAWTSDLSTWETTTIDLGAIADDATAPLRSDVFANSLAIVGDRWMAQVERQTWVEYESLLPADVRASINSPEGGYSIGTTPSGIRLEIYDATGTPTTSDFTWQELGLDGDPQVTDDAASHPLILTGVFGAGYEQLPAPAGFEYGTMTTLGDQFVLIGNGAHVTTDGRSWTTIDGLPSDVYLNSISPVDGGHLLVGDGPNGSTAWLRRDDGSVTEVQLPALSEPYGVWNQNASSAAWVVELGSGTGDETWDPVTVTVDYERFVLTIVNGPDGTDYSLADGTTGEILRTGTVDPNSPDGDIWQYDEATGEASVVVTAEDGTELVRIPAEVMNEAYDRAYGAATPSEPQDWNPDLWLIATADGTNWLTIDLADPDPESGFWPNGAAINNGSVLFQTADGWVLEPLPT
jgi:hypothetical protein